MSRVRIDFEIYFERYRHTPSVEYTASRLIQRTSAPTISDHVRRIHPYSMKSELIAKCK